VDRVSLAATRHSRSLNCAVVGIFQSGLVFCPASNINKELLSESG
jgi:hypothetical protein